MFNVGFGEMLIFVTGASFLLGRQELMLGARYAGKLLGRAIGTMHGLKANYEANNAKNDLQTLHTSVRSGLRDLSTVGYDIMSVTPMGMMSTPLGLSQSYKSNAAASSSNTNQKDQKTPIFSPGTGTKNGIEPTPSPGVVINPLDGKTIQMSSINRPAISADIQGDPERRAQTTAANRHLSRIIIAERELADRLEREAANNYATRAALSDSASQQGGADVVHSVISECILADTYR